MIFHTYKTITIGRFAEMQELNDLSLLKRLPVPLPRIMLERAFKRLMVAYNEYANADKLRALIETDAGKIKAMYKINYFDALEKAIASWIISQDADLKRTVDELFKTHYKRYPKNDEDLARVTKDKELFILKYKQIFEDETPEENKEAPSFESYLVQLEMALAPVTIRDKKLYLLQMYIDKATRTNGRN